LSHGFIKGLFADCVLLYHISVEVIECHFLARAKIMKLGQLRPIGEGKQELEKRLDQEELT
jgi:hypothetical protein